MTKKTFLKKLESKLTNLDEQEIAKIIKKYDHIIDEEVKSGKEEKDVVSSLGDIDMIAKLYSTNIEGEKNTTEREKVGNSKHDGTSKKGEPENEKWTADRVINVILTSIDDAFKSIDGDLAKRILTIICFVAVGVVLLSLIHIPFRILDLIGTGMFRTIFNDYDFFKLMSSFWSFSLGICYAVLVIWLIVHYINQISGRYTKRERKETIYKEEPKMEEVKEVKKETVYSHDTATSAFDIIYLILKIIIILMTIPIIMLESCLFVALFFTVSLTANGVALYGPVMIVIGVIFLIASLLDLIYRSLSKGGIK